MSISIRSTTVASRCATLLIAITAALAPLACSEDISITAPVEDAARLYLGLAVDHEAVTMSTRAPWDTLRLRITPTTGTGAIIDTTGAELRFTTTDSSRVLVTPDGLLKAVRTGSNVVVTAHLRIGNVTRTTATRINVTAVTAPPAFDTLSIQPAATDSAKTFIDRGLGLHGTATRLPIRVRSSTGAAITGVLVQVASSDTAVARVSLSGLTAVNVTGHRQGRVKFYASATIYGVKRVDTLDYVIGGFIASLLVPRLDPLRRSTTYIWNPVRTRIVAGGYVMFIWHNKLPAPSKYAIEFDKPEAALEDTAVCKCGSGNIAVFGDTLNWNNFLAYKTRRFTTPGIYRYRSPQFGELGEIEVLPDTIPAPSSLHSTRIVNVGN